jgi:hypothetical protein
LRQVPVEESTVPQDAVADLAFGLVGHERANFSREVAPRAEHADGAGGTDYQEDRVIGVDEARPEARLVGAQLSPRGKDRVQHRVDVVSGEAGFRGVDPLLKDPEHGVRKALGDVAARGEAEAEYVFADPGGGGDAAFRAQPHEATLPPFGGVRRELVEERLVVISEEEHIIVKQVGDVP